VASALQLLRHLDVLLLENDLAAVVGDFRGAPFPFDLIKWRWLSPV
jgi:hypothetical protein